MKGRKMIVYAVIEHVPYEATTVMYLCKTEELAIAKLKEIASGEEYTEITPKLWRNKYDCMLYTQEQEVLEE